MFRRFRPYFLVLATALLAMVLTAPPALAQSLDQLRASGAVGERFDGYAQALDSSAAGAVKQVNAKRKQIYAKEAKKTGAPIGQVGRVFAGRIFKQAPAGTKFLQENGKWVTK